MKRVLGGLGLGLALAFLSTATAQAAPLDSAGAHPSVNTGFGGAGDLLGGLTGGASPLGLLTPSSNGSGSNLLGGLMSHPTGGLTGASDTILPHGILDGGKSHLLPVK